MFPASFRRFPTVPLCFCLSEPARSTKFNLEILSLITLFSFFCKFYRKNYYSKKKKKLDFSFYVKSENRMRSRTFHIHVSRSNMPISHTFFHDFQQMMCISNFFFCKSFNKRTFFDIFSYLKTTIIGF